MMIYFETYIPIARCGPHSHTKPRSPAARTLLNVEFELGSDLPSERLVSFLPTPHTSESRGLVAL